jgi:biopolymer transport protein ExbD
MAIFVERVKRTADIATRGTRVSVVSSGNAMVSDQKVISVTIRASKRDQYYGQDEQREIARVEQQLFDLVRRKSEAVTVLDQVFANAPYYQTVLEPV